MTLTLTPDVHVAAVEHDEAPHQRQAHAQATAGAFERSVALGENLEDLRQHVRRDADARVADADAHPIRMFGNLADRLGDQPDVSRCRGELDRIVQQIHQHLGEPHRIRVHIHRFRRQRHVHRVAGLLGEGSGRFHRLVDHRSELDPAFPKLDTVVRDAAQIEEIVDEPHELSKLPLHHVDGLRNHLPVVAGALQDFDHVAQRSERIAKLVR